jgi:hypothetical protein
MQATAKKLVIARIALFALLFSAFSSTFASLYLQDRGGILAEICTTSGVRKVLPPPGDTGQHAPGKTGAGIYCAQCLNSAAAPALATPSVTALFAMIAGGAPVTTVEPADVSTSRALSPPPRGPPATF